MDKRDVKTRFRHQKLLHENRPDAHPKTIKRLQKLGRVSTVESFDFILSDTELAAVFALDGEEMRCLRINPDVVVNLGISLIKAGNQIGWFQTTIHEVKPPQAH